jgi:hypothetical protein
MCHRPHATDIQTTATDTDSVHSAQSTHVTLSTLGAAAPDVARDEFALLQTHMRTRDKVKMLLNKESMTHEMRHRRTVPGRFTACRQPRSVGFATAKSPSRDSKALSLPSDVSRCYKRKR